MKVEVSREAAEHLETQTSYLMNADAPEAAQRLRTRVMDFLANHLSVFPKTGRFLREADLWETWIPRTRLIVWYRIVDDQLVVVAFWHTSQDRTQSHP